MGKVDKISISLSPEDAKWARARAKKLKTSVSGVLSEALRRERQAEARRKLVAELGARSPRTSCAPCWPSGVRPQRADGARP